MVDRNPPEFDHWLADSWPWIRRAYRIRCTSRVYAKQYVLSTPQAYAVAAGDDWLLVGRASGSFPEDRWPTWTSAKSQRSLLIISCVEQYVRVC